MGILDFFKKIIRDKSKVGLKTKEKRMRLEKKKF